LISIGLVVFLIGVGWSQIEKEKEMRKVEFIVLREEIDSLEKHLQAYEDKVDDLSVAFINHHGNYPRRIK